MEKPCSCVLEHCLHQTWLWRLHIALQIMKNALPGKLISEILWSEINYVECYIGIIAWYRKIKIIFWTDVFPVIFFCLHELDKTFKFIKCWKVILYKCNNRKKLVFHEFFSTLKSWMVVDGENLINDVLTCHLNCIFFLKYNYLPKLQNITIHSNSWYLQYQVFLHEFIKLYYWWSKVGNHVWWEGQKMIRQIWLLKF